MSFRYPERADPGLANSTGNSESSQVEWPNRRVLPSHPKAHIPQATASIERSSGSTSGSGSGSGIVNTGSSQPGSLARNQGSDNKIDAADTATTATSATSAATDTTKQDKSPTTPQRQASIRHRGKRGKGSKKKASTKTKTKTKTKAKAETKKTTKKNKTSRKLDKVRKKQDSGLLSTQPSGHKEQKTSQEGSDGREKDGRNNNGGNVNIMDSPSAQVPAFFHLLLFESLGAPDNELKNEYVRECRRLARLYRLDLTESEGQAAEEYMKNRSAGLVALENREKIMAVQKEADKSDGEDTHHRGGKFT